MSFRIRDTTTKDFVDTVIASTTDDKSEKDKKTEKKAKSVSKKSGGFQVKQDFTNESDFF